MELQAIIPTQKGQICRIINPLEDEDPQDVFILVENPVPYNGQDNIYVVNLKDLQRNIMSPESSPQIAVVKNDLSVIADNLEEYIKSWNNI